MGCIMSDIKLYTGDCLEVMKDIPEHSIDMILCDLPYGTTACKWDVLIPFDRLWEQYKRVIKDNGAILLFGTEPFSSAARLSNLDWYKYDLVWQKEKPVNFFQLKRRFGKTTENIMVFYKKQPTYNPQMEMSNKPRVINKPKGKHKSIITGVNKEVLPYNDTGYRYPCDVLNFNREKLGSAIHDTQKPVKLLEYLIKTFSDEGDVVLDNCMGSGSTGVACIRTGRNFIGIEKDEKYFEITKKRIEDERKSFALWE